MAKMEELDDEIDRREYRRRRRVRNQIISYVVLGVFLVGVILGGVIGVNKLIAGMKDRKQAEELQKQLDELSQAEQEPQVGHTFSSNSLTSSSVIFPAAWEPTASNMEERLLFCP